jgi:hypothetical protein
MFTLGQYVFRRMILSKKSLTVTIFGLDGSGYVDTISLHPLGKPVFSTNLKGTSNKIL